MTAIPSSIPALFESVAQTVNPAQSPAQDATGESAAPDITTEISISSEAKAAFERVESERVAVERLVQALSQDSSAKANKVAFDKIAGALSNDELSFDDLVASPEAEPEDTKDGKLQGLSPEKKAAMDAKLREIVESFVISNADRHSAEGGQALREAIANGTVRVRKAEDVPGVNYKSTVTHTEGPYGKGMSVSASFNPSPEIRAEIDSGHGLAMWSKSQGDVYLSW